MNEHDLKITIEATLLAAGRPVTSQQLLDLFEERERPSDEQLQAALEPLAADYNERGIELIEVASGWRIQVRQRCIDIVSRLWQERPSKYSRALLETLALVAYRQPITRSEIEEIRGVSISSTIMRTLQERNWIRVVGHREVPGRPELLRHDARVPRLLRAQEPRSIADARRVARCRNDRRAARASRQRDRKCDELPTRPRLKSLARSDESSRRDVADEASEDDSTDDDAEVVADASSEDPELSADADEVDDEEATPTLVASDEHDAERRFGEPPNDQ